jgi:hypothetical protein
MEQILNVGIIGGGVSGSVIALKLAELGMDSVLFEQEDSLVNGPPFCHLHAGGNLYPDISDNECRLLMKQSIEMAKMFPQSIDERPTFFSVPKAAKYEPSTIEARLNMLVSYYKELIKNDASNEIINTPETYFKKYSREDLTTLLQEPSVKQPQTVDEWMRNTLNVIDVDKLKTPVFMVQEYGWNMFRLAAQAQLGLTESNNCSLKLNTKVEKIIDVKDQELAYNWEILANGVSHKVKYLVNACGFRTANIDAALQVKSERLIEFKAAYVSKWDHLEEAIPELIFHGERGTPNGMAQLTPYCDNYFQIHGMTTDITLFKGGVLKTGEELQPAFSKEINQKINKNWDKEELTLRTENAIQYVTEFVPDFESASPGGPAFYGAQQVVGNDINLRVAEVSFPSKAYARCEIIKASSALTVANKIIENLEEEGIKSKGIKPPALNKISKTEIDEMAEKLAVLRGYPKSLSMLIIDKD